MIREGIIAAVSIGVLCYGSSSCQGSIYPLFDNNLTLEERMYPPAIQQYCANYKFDSRWAQEQFGNKCVSYFKANGREVIAIYEAISSEEGILTAISNDEHVERKRVRVEIDGTYPWEDLFEIVKNIELSPVECEKLISLFILYKDLLLRPQQNK